MSTYDPWDMYENRMDMKGDHKRELVKRRALRTLDRKLRENLSFQEATMLNGTPQDLVIVNTDNLNIKTVYSMTNETFPHGGYVYWRDNYWLITEKDANNELYTKGKMTQCNYLLKWVDAVERIVVERWCVVTDSTKYLTGEYGDYAFVMTKGDTRLYVALPKDDYTVKLNRDSRFIIDDYNVTNTDALAYRLSKPIKVSNVYNEEGIYEFILTECNSEYDDNLELHIADYYTFFPASDIDEDGNSESRSRNIPYVTPGDTQDTAENPGNEDGCATDHAGDMTCEDNTFGRGSWL